MANNVTRLPTQQLTPMPGTQQGNWFWDGSNWVCGTCDDGGGFPFCPPPGFPPGGCPPWFSGANSPPWYPGANAGVSFGTTAPLNPVRGHFWWNGVVLGLFDGAVWVNTATGAIIPSTGGGTPVVPAGPSFTTTTGVFSMVQSQNLSIPPSTGSTFTITPFVSSPTVDLMTAYDQTTKKWTPTRAGIYMVFILGFGAPATTAYSQCVLRNDQGAFNFGTPVQTVCIYDNITPGGPGIWNAAGICNMNGTTDYLRHWSYTGTGTVNVLPTSSPTWAVFAMP